MVRRANRYFQSLKTKGILSVFRLAKGDYSSRERERALCKRQAASSWNLLNLLCVRYLELLAGLGRLSFPAELQREGSVSHSSSRPSGTDSAGLPGFGQLGYLTQA